jgi:hypothetical protein
LEALEDRLAPVSNLSIADASAIEPAPGGTTIMNFTVTRSGDLTSPLTVGYTTIAGTAQAGTDFTPETGTTTFAAGSDTATIAIPILGNGVYNNPSLTFSLELTNFATQQPFAAGNLPARVAVADVNGDGKPDLIAASGSSVTVQLNTTATGSTTPTFAAAQQAFATGSGAQYLDLTVADLNGDGKPDIVVADVWVLLNTTVTGATIATFAAPQTFASGVSVADVNGDGKPDLIGLNSYSYSYYSYSPPAVSVLLNETPAGATIASFATPQPFATGSSPVSVAVSDVNGDGKPDLVVANADNTLSVLLNTTATGATTPAFAGPITIATGNPLGRVTVSDVNGDGKPDLIGANYVTNTVEVLLNTTATGATKPSFAGPITIATGNPLGRVTVSDVNGDGKPDLVLANQSANTVSVLLNQTATGALTPSFANQVAFAAGSRPTSVAVGDVNGDGKSDLVVAKSGNLLSVLLNASVTATGTIIESDLPTVQPTITVSATSLDLGTPTLGTGGTAKTYTVSGSSLTAPIIITAPNGVEVSSDNGASYKTTVTLTPTGGGVASTTINVRIASSAALGAISGKVTNASAGATQQEVTVTGTVKVGPTITVSATSLDLGTTIVGVPKEAGTYTVSGSNLTGPITITAPSGFEISLADDPDASYHTTVALTPTSGTVASTTINVRIASSAALGAISGKVTNASAGATQQDVTVTGTVNPAGGVRSSGTLFLEVGGNASNTSVAAAPSKTVKVFIDAGDLLGLAGGIQSGTFYVKYDPTVLSISEDNPGAAGSDIQLGDLLTPFPAGTYSVGTAAGFGSGIVGVGLTHATHTFYTGTAGGHLVELDFHVLQTIPVDVSTVLDMVGSVAGKLTVLADKAGSKYTLTPGPQTYAGNLTQTGALTPGTVTPADSDRADVAIQVIAGTKPTITISATSLDLGTTTVGTPGTAKTYTVSGSNVTAPITITAPTGAEISSDSGASYRTTVTLTPTGGTVASTTINVRSAASATAGAISGKVTNVSAGATQQDVTVTGTVARGLTVKLQTTTATGFTVTFTRPIDTSKVFLYGGTVTGPIQNVTLVGAHNGPVNGSFIIDPSGTWATFKASSTFLQTFFQQSVLPNDTWTVTLVSGTGTGSSANGFFDMLGGPLDGVGNGGHANYTTSFTTANDGKPALSIPDFARGPDGATTIKVPNDSSKGIPVTLANANAATDVVFTLTYNPTLLTPTGAATGDSSGMSSTFVMGTTVSVDATHSTVTFTWRGAAQSGMVVLGDILANVPNSAANPYKGKEILTLSDIKVNGADFTGMWANGLHVNTYFGDVTGDGKITGLDVATAGAVAGGSSLGLSAFKLVDPAVVGDIAGDASIDATAVSDLAAITSSLPTPQIPAIPTGLTITPGGPDPTLSLANGNGVVSVLLDHPHPVGSTGMEEAVLALTYDPKVLTVSSSDITLGSIPGLGSGWRLVSVVDQATGQIGIDLYSTTPIAATQAGSLVNIAFHVEPGAPPPATAVQLVNSVTPNGRYFSTEVADDQGQYVLSPGVDRVMVETGPNLVPQSPSSNADKTVFARGQVLLNLLKAIRKRFFP